MKFDSNRLGLALAAALSGVFTVCTLLAAFAPGFVAYLDHGLIHHHMVALTANDYISGVVATAFCAYLVGAFFAYAYNNLSK